jgi:hypothetical protein
MQELFWLNEVIHMRGMGSLFTESNIDIRSFWFLRTVQLDITINLESMDKV